MNIDLHNVVFAYETIEERVIRYGALYIAFAVGGISLYAGAMGLFLPAVCGTVLTTALIWRAV